MKIALSIICKGTESKYQTLRLLDSVAKHVDGIFVTYTWAKGEAVEMFEKFGANISYFQWIKQFDAARNFAKEQIPEEYDYMLWLDMDDELQGGEKLHDLAERSNADAIYFTYNYQIDPKTGEILQQHPRERLVKPNKFKWVGKLHETLIPNCNVKNVFTKDVVVNHFPDKDAFEEGIKRNIDILEQAYEDEGKNKDPRTEYYLARCYFDAQRYEEAEKLFTEYLKHSGWDEERAVANNYLAEICSKRLDFDKAVTYLLEAIRERPEFPTWYISLSVMYAQKKDYDRALFYVKQGLSLKQPETAMVLTPRDDKLRALEVVYTCCMKKNMLKEALEASRKVLEMFPDDKDYKERVEYTEYLIKNVDIGKSLLEIVKRLEKNNPDKIEGLLNMLPEDLQETALIERLRQKHAPIKKHEGITYFCGKGFEKWDETSLKNGIGGSETAVIQLSKEWAKSGKKVTVYGDPFDEHETDGVFWRPYWRFSARDEFDTLIIWRNESLLDADLKAKKIFFDAHDVINPLEWTKERVAKVTKIFVKSEYHRSFIPNVPDEKIAIVPNGIDLSIIPDNYKKIKNRLVYCSSYDRGLEYGLKYGWPIIKKEIPDAELHIYYGWNLFDSFYSNNPERMEWKRKMQELMKQDGVFEHGRISQKDLIEEKAKCVVHYYPCTFEEIDCISVRESAAVDCIPYTTKYAALKDRAYCVNVKGDPFEKETHENLAKRIVDCLKEKERILFSEYARKESWENIANIWFEKICE